MIIGNKIHIGSRRKVINGTRLNLSPEVKAYISGLTTPLSLEQVTKLDTFVRTVKTGLGITALSEAFDVMYILGGETAESSLKNIVKDAHHATAINSPAFTAFEGFAGNGTSTYINVNLAPANAISFSQNDISIGIYSRTNNVETKVDFGTKGPFLAGQLSLIPKYNINSIEAFVNTNSAIYLLNNFDTTGIQSMRRNIATTAYYNSHKNKLTFSQNSAPPVSQNIFLFCLNDNGSTRLFSTKQFSLFFAGKYIDDSQHDTLCDAFEAYMDSNGKGVIA